jgi:hypothetical protein
MYLKKLFQRSKSNLWNNIAWEGRAILDSNMTPFFRFVNKWAIYRLGIISLAHGPVHVTDFPVVNVTNMLMNCHESFVRKISHRNQFGTDTQTIAITIAKSRGTIRGVEEGKFIVYIEFRTTRKRACVWVSYEYLG